MEELIIKQEEFNKELAELINKSGLPAFIVEPILKDYYNQVVELKNQQYQQAIQITEEKKQKEIEQKKDKEKKGEK